MRELWDEREGFQLNEKEKARLQRESECEERVRKTKNRTCIEARSNSGATPLATIRRHLFEYSSHVIIC